MLHYTQVLLQGGYGENFAQLIAFATTDDIYVIMFAQDQNGNTFGHRMLSMRELSSKSHNILYVYTACNPQYTCMLKHVICPGSHMAVRLNSHVMHVILMIGVSYAWAYGTHLLKQCLPKHI